MPRVFRLLVRALPGLVLLLGAAAADADLPLSFQGYLTDAQTGQPVQSLQPIPLTMQVWDCPACDDAADLLAEGHADVEVAGGLFVAYPDFDAAAETRILAGMTAGSSLYLGVVVRQEPELRPRVPLGAGIYSLMAGRTEQAEQATHAASCDSAALLGQLSAADFAAKDHTHPEFAHAWTDTRMGAGSGLDADKLDGLEAQELLGSAVQQVRDSLTAGLEVDGNLAVGGEAQVTGSLDVSGTLRAEQVEGPMFAALVWAGACLADQTHAFLTRAFVGETCQQACEIVVPGLAPTCAWGQAVFSSWATGSSHRFGNECDTPQQDPADQVGKWCCCGGSFGQAVRAVAWR